MNKRITLLIFLLLMACDVPTEDYNNPLDLEVGMATPALVIFPNEVNVNIEETFTVNVYALDVENVAGAYIKLDYNQNKLLLMAINPGTFFSDLQDPLYFTETENSGTIELYTIFLGADSTSVSGTGSFMSIVFSASAGGVSSLTYSPDCGLVDPDDNPIEIKGFGFGVVNAQ